METRQEAFEHCKYGTGAKPGAYRKMADGSEFSMGSERGWVSVTYFPVGYCGNRDIESEQVAIRNAPAVGWVTYWTGEA